IIETLSRADGSAGWSAMIGSDGGFYSSFLDDEAGRSLYPDLDAVTAGGVLPAGRLDRGPDGYRLSGRFSFASGIAHADLVVARAIWADKIILPDMTPARNEPRVRATIARAEAMVGSVRSYTYDLLGSFWDTLAAGDTPTLEQRAALAGSFAYTFQTCRDAVQLLYQEVGSQSVYRGCPLDR